MVSVSFIPIAPSFLLPCAEYATKPIFQIVMAEQRLLLIQHGQMGMTISPNGRTLWACSHDASTITIFDVDSVRALRDFATAKGWKMRFFS